MRVSSPWCGGVWATGLACLALVGSGVDAAAADAPLPSEFAWRGTLALPTGASLVRVDVPVPALLRMQNSAAHDLRVFNGAGAVVPFALLGTADVNRAALVVQTGSYKAYPLFAATSAEKAPRGGVEVRVESAGQHSTAWVRMDNADSGPDALAAGAQPLQAALFDMRTEKQALEALVLALELPHNAQNDWMERLDKDEQGIGWQLNGDHVQRSRLRIEARKWLMGKLKPKKYGEKLDVDLTDRRTVSIIHLGGRGPADSAKKAG